MSCTPRVGWLLSLPSPWRRPWRPAGGLLVWASQRHPLQQQLLLLSPLGSLLPSPLVLPLNWQAPTAAVLPQHRLSHAMTPTQVREHKKNSLVCIILVGSWHGADPVPSARQGHQGWVNFCCMTCNEI